MSGKGDTRRPGDDQAYRDHYDRIFSRWPRPAASPPTPAPSAPPPAPAPLTDADLDRILSAPDGPECLLDSPDAP